MERLPAWEHNLYRTLDHCKNRPFQWGAHDCCFFAARCVEAMTGHNPMTRFNPDYTDKKGARAFLKTRAGGTLLKTLEGLFGPPVHPAFLARGDLLYKTGKQGPTLGVCLGQMSAFVGEEGGRPGLVYLATLSGRWGFKI